MNRGRRESIVQPLSIGRIDDAGLELSQLKMSQCRPDETVNLPAVLVVRTRTLAPLACLEPLVERLAHRRSLPVDPAGVRLCDKSGEALSDGTLTSRERLRRVARLPT